MVSLDPIIQFQEWYEQAAGAGIDKPHAMTLSTIGPDGRPSCRVVLLSSFDEKGFVFHTNYESRKGQEIAHEPRVALTFWWDSLGYQVRIEGWAEKTSQEESDAYFSGRPRGSQLGAWVSDQSKPIEDRVVLEERMRALELEYADLHITRPPHWGGYRVKPDTFEFWENRENRLHHRVLYTRQSDGSWITTHLAP